MTYTIADCKASGTEDRLVFWTINGSGFRPVKTWKTERAAAAHLGKMRAGMPTSAVDARLVVVCIDDLTPARGGYHFPAAWK